MLKKAFTDLINALVKRANEVYGYSIADHSDAKKSNEIKKFETSRKSESLKKSEKTKVFDWIESFHRPVHRKDIIQYIVENVRHKKFDPIKDRGIWSGAFSIGCSTGAYYQYPTKDEPRCLARVERGMYMVCR